MKQQLQSGASTEINISNLQEKQLPPSYNCISRNISSSAWIDTPMSSSGEPAHPWRSPGYHAVQHHKKATGGYLVPIHQHPRCESESNRQVAASDSSYTQCSSKTIISKTTTAANSSSTFQKLPFTLLLTSGAAKLAEPPTSGKLHTSLIKYKSSAPKRCFREQVVTKPHPHQGHVTSAA
ncbi:hypothetical protein Nepgr_004059 [Nepenthes gracilis]|uniref:Uncharacterized protein n=1 Tax=Nepenthes gracilis TaxID=150966 RepID=A0AAD3XER4_NEPGR|nr:hypothetical protein Nepgr_004059 [Nepenthes gracilis]